MIRYSRARGLLVVDESVESLVDLLRSKNFWVVVLPTETQDNVIIEAYYAGRVIVTLNVEDFVDLAPIYEFGIIGVAADAMANPSNVAKVISAQYSERALRHCEPFLLSIMPHSTTFRLLE